jgi:hypothetical protein
MSEGIKKSINDENIGGGMFKKKLSHTFIHFECTHLIKNL